MRADLTTVFHKNTCVFYIAFGLMFTPTRTDNITRLITRFSVKRIELGDVCGFKLRLMTIQFFALNWVINLAFG